MFLSERFNVKEAATLCGAAAAVSEEVDIATPAQLEPVVQAYAKGRFEGRQANPGR